MVGLSGEGGGLTKRKPVARRMGTQVMWILTLVLGVLVGRSVLEAGRGGVQGRRGMRRTGRRVSKFEGFG